MTFTLQLGETAPDFDLPGVDGRNYSLADLGDAKVGVILFSCNHCPYVIGSEDRMIALHRDYAPRGMAFIVINSNEAVDHPTDSFEHMCRTRAREGLRVSLYPGRGPGRGPGLRRPSHASLLRLRRRAHPAIHGPHGRQPAHRH